MMCGERPSSGCWLVRHDRPQMAPGLCYGASDVPLAIAPAQTLARVGARLPQGLPVYASPLQRCAALARALSDTVHWHDGLREIDYGTWEMQPWDALDVQGWADDPFGYAFPGGESVPAFLARVRAALAHLPPDVLVITHGGVIRAALHILQGLPLAQAFATPVPYGCVVCLPQE